MFLSMSVSSGDDDSRNIRTRDESSFSGKFIVEDIIENNEHYRRLIFLNRGNVIQSEVKLTKGKFRFASVDINEIIDLV